MQKESYVKLAERMNQFEGRYPIIDAYINVLKVMCTEEEAEFAAAFPARPLTLGEAAKIYKKDESEIKKLIEAMAWKGMIFTSRTETGEKLYELTPIVPGAMEYYILRRLDKPDEIKKYLDLYTQLNIESAVYIEKLKAENPEKVKEVVPSQPLFRTLTINEALPEKTTVYQYEDILKMIDKHTSFAAMLCTCKEGIGPNTTGPCQVEGVPRHHCLQFGKTADNAVEQNLADAKRITKEECLDILMACNKAGLVQNVNNFVDELQFICNCCPCCCGIVKGAKLLGPIQSGIVDTTNFLPMVDNQICTGCGECVEHCPVSALSLKDDVASCNKDACLGCGFCKTICPVESITMERVSNKKLELGERKVGFGFGGA